ncbi:glycine cleavage system aminomethyltransferase GcvT [Corynebacterium sp. 335C]
MSDSTAEAPRRSHLHDQHIALGAEMSAVGGWEVPLKYESELEEHRAVREDVGIFDLSPMGEIRVTGPEAPQFLAHSLISAMKPIALGKAKYTMMVQEDGGIIDDLIAYRLGVEDYLLVPNAGNSREVLETLRERVGGYEVDIADQSKDTALIAVQGPRAGTLLLRLIPEDSHDTLHELRYYSCTSMEIAGAETLIGRTGYTGEDGFEIFVPAADAASVWESLLAAGAERDDEEGLPEGDDGRDLRVRPCGLLARNTLRIEAGMPLYGRELTRERNPLEAGFASLISPSKGQFTGRKALVNQPEPKQRLAGVKIAGRKAPERGAGLRDADGNAVGVITSTTVSPTLGYPIAMAYIDRWLAVPGTALTVEVEGAEKKAEVTPIPFYNRRKRK